MLCATIRDDDVTAISCACKEADLLELSLDKFQPSDLAQLRSLCTKPVIFKLIEVDFSQLSHLPDYVDLPHTTPAEVFEEVHRRFPTIKRICSFHDFEKTGDLESIYSELRSLPAEIYKIATMANSTVDALRMLQFVKKYQCLGICMGELGAITRILAAVVGAPWTYAPLSEEQRTAPGQLLLNEIVDVYNYRAHTPATALYGLIGDPVSKSPSHQTHNSHFKKLGLDAVYVKMRLEKQELSTCFPLFRALGFKGLSVTMPLKEQVVPFLDHYKDRAVNTIGFREEGVYGWNTDGPGALDALEKRGRVEGKRLALLGAGGAAWGIAMEAKKRGAKLMIFNRTLERAQALAQEVEGEAFALSDFAQADYDILINCTSVGMGEDKRLPVPPALLLSNRLVMDIISRPPITPLLEAAQQKGCPIVQGMEMFTEQASGQYRHWFGSK